MLNERTTPVMRSPIQHSTLNIQHSTLRFVLPLITSTIILAIWAISVKLSGTKIFPSPVAVAKAIASLSEKSLLWRYIGDSLTRVFTGYAAAIVAGIPIGFLMGW